MGTYYNSILNVNEGGTVTIKIFAGMENLSKFQD